MKLGPPRGRSCKETHRRGGRVAWDGRFGLTTRLTGVDLLVHVARLDDEDVLVDTAGLDVGSVTHLAPRNHEDVRPLTERT
jgi:hypothetical protein